MCQSVCVTDSLTDSPDGDENDRLAVEWDSRSCRLNRRTKDALWKKVDKDLEEEEQAEMEDVEEEEKEEEL